MSRFIPFYITWRSFIKRPMPYAEFIVERYCPYILFNGIEFISHDWPHEKLNKLTEKNTSMRNDVDFLGAFWLHWMLSDPRCSTMVKMMAAI